MSKEWTAEQYDELYRASDEYKKHYTESMYWPVWQEVLKRIPKNVSVLEFGCGTGQFANALKDRGILDYNGVDFSFEAVRIANRDRGVYFSDIKDFYPLNDYDYLVCLETLEHIEDDFTVLNRIRPGKRCLITVPSYGGPNHVRHFPRKQDVWDRYDPFFGGAMVFGFALNSNQTIWLIDGVRNETF